ncbi:MAG: glycosyltransferase family 4 protein [Patescibacteria group bacterium]|nr:glycosyltransferase family 4 protein [Patescibacteria group bacterium]
MKIALIALHLNTKGGTQRQALALARAFSKLGHAVTVFAFQADYERCYGEEMKELNIKTLQVPLVRFLGSNPLVRKIRSKLKFEKDAKTLAQCIPFDIEYLNCQDEESYKVGYYFRRAYPRTTARITWTMNDPPISYRPKSTLFFEWGRRMWNIFEGVYERRFMRVIDTIFVLDKRNKELVKRFYKHPSIILGSGVDFNYFHHSVKRYSSERPLHILGVGIFFPHRRFEDIIRAAGILRDKGVAFEVHIIGDPADEPYASLLYGLVKELRLESCVKFLGKVMEKDLLLNYRESDVFVFPNHIQTFGLAPAEAMAAGLPVIVSRTAGFADLLTDGENALLVDPLRPDKIAECIMRYKEDPDEMFCVAERGQKFVKSTIAWERRAEAMLDH